MASSLGFAGSSASVRSGIPSASRSATLVSPLGIDTMTSPESVTVGRVGMMGVPSCASNASGAPATSESFTSVQSSPDRFCTIPQACRSACPSGWTTSRYDGRQTGAAAMYPT